MTQLVLIPSKGTVRVPHAVPSFLIQQHDMTLLRNGQLLRWIEQPQLGISSDGLNNLLKFLKLNEYGWSEAFDSRTILNPGVHEIQRHMQQSMSDLDQWAQLSEDNRMVFFKVLGITSHCIAFDANLTIKEFQHG